MDRQLLREIKQKQLSAVYLFYGEETFSMEETCEWMTKQLLGEQVDPWNKVVLDLEEVPIQQLVQEAETASFFGDLRLIIGKNASFLTPQTKRQELEHRPEALITYLQDPVPGNIILFLCPSAKLDKRRKVVKEIEKNARVVAFPRLSEKELVKWIPGRCKQLNVSITEPAVMHLIRLVGNDLRQIYQECVKLATYVGKSGKITPEIVEALVPRTLEQDVFKLTEYVSKQKIDEAFNIWYDLLYQKEEPIRILALLIRQFRLMLQTKVLGAQGKSEKEIAAFLGVHPYPVKLAARQGKAFTESKLRSLLAEAIRADQEIKAGKLEKHLAVERLLLCVQPS